MCQSGLPIPFFTFLQPAHWICNDNGNVTVTSKGDLEEIVTASIFTVQLHCLLWMVVTPCLTVKSTLTVLWWLSHYCGPQGSLKGAGVCSILFPYLALLEFRQLAHLQCNTTLWQGLPHSDLIHPAVLYWPQCRPFSNCKRCREGWFWGGCHVWTMQIPVFWQLSEEVPLDSWGCWSIPAPSPWSCAPSRRCREVSSRTWSWKPRSFSQRQRGGSKSHCNRGGWKWQET